MTMVNYAILNAAGQTIKSGIAQESTVNNLVGPGEQLVITSRTADPVNEIVIPPNTPENPTSTPVVEPRPAPGAAMVASKTTFTADGVDYVRIPNIPAGATLTITVPEATGVAPIAPVTVNDGLVDINTTVAGTYRVTIQKYPYQDYVVTLYAN